MNKTDEHHVDMARLILDSIEGEVMDLNGIVPNDIKVVGLQFICQFRMRNDPDRVCTLNIEHGQPVALQQDGSSYEEPAKDDDFPDVEPFQIYPS